MNEKIRSLCRKIPIIYDLQHNIRVKINEKKHKDRKIAYDKWGKEILKNISDMTINNGYKCICIEGTLLGIVRDGQLIPWDDDLDFAFVGYSDFDWNKFEKDMKKSGFWKYREIEDNGIIITQSYKKKKVLCDFSVWYEKDGVIELAYGGYQIPGYQYDNAKIGKYEMWDKILPAIRNVIIQECDGIKVQIPENSNEVLAAIYGENWNIPDSKYRSEEKKYEKELKVTYFRKPFMADFWK